MDETMPRKFKEEMFDSIDSRLLSYMPERRYPTEIATTFNFILYDEFKKNREYNGMNYNLKPIFVGQYMVDPLKPEQTRVYSHQGTEACSPISISRGVIGRAIRTGLDQYVPDVTKDSNHIGCDPDMEGSELVLLSLSDPYLKGHYQGSKIPLGVLDLDFNIKNALEKEDIDCLRKIWDMWGKKIFPGHPKFLPRKEAYKSYLMAS
ncbi:MAG: hypothetical protein Q7S27_03675 [Nanoarchaeota archaeon]|nr:hypothetical protein [Nanoarchaeota archaeon]